jgi:hypothetical protein
MQVPTYVLARLSPCTTGESVRPWESVHPLGTCTPPRNPHTTEESVHHPLGIRAPPVHSPGNPCNRWVHGCQPRLWSGLVSPHLVCPSRRRGRGKTTPAAPSPFPKLLKTSTQRASPTMEHVIDLWWPSTCTCKCLCICISSIFPFTTSDVVPYAAPSAKGGTWSR